MRLKAKLKFIERLKTIIKQKIKLWNRHKNTCKVAIKFRFTVGSCAGNNYSSWGTLKIVTEIKPTILFHRSENGEKHNLIEQIATDKVKELIKTSDSNIIDVEIHSVTLL